MPQKEHSIYASLSPVLHTGGNDGCVSSVISVDMTDIIISASPLDEDSGRTPSTSSSCDSGIGSLTRCGMLSHSHNRKSLDTKIRVELAMYANIS